MAPPIKMTLMGSRRKWRKVDISKFCAKVPTFSTFMLGFLISMTETAILYFWLIC